MTRLLVAVLVFTAAGATPASGAESPGSLVVFASEPGIHVARSDGGRRRALTRHAPTGPVVGASTDGRAVFFQAANDGGLWRLELSTRRVRPFGPSAARPLDPVAVSPTGRFVAGFSGRNLEVWSSAGKRIYAVRALPPNVFPAEPPAWSPAEKRLAYAVDPLESPARGGLWVAAIGAERPVRVARGGLFDPSWAPDGRLAALITRKPDSVGCPCQAALIRSGRAERTGQEASDVAWSGRNELLVRTPQQTLLLAGREIANRVGPLWGISPDGDAALIQRGGRFVVVPLDRGEPRVLDAGASETAVWSASGEIVFDTPSDELYAIDARTGRGKRRLTLRVADYDPVLSPSGDTVAFARTTPRGQSVLLVPTTGGPARRVSAGSRPTWSPDGRSLIVSAGGPSRGDDSQLALYAVRRDGSGRRWLARGSSARWSPDGSRIVYLTRRATSSSSRGTSFRRTLWLMWADSRRPRRRLHVVTNTPLWGPEWVDTHAHVVYGVGRRIYTAGGDQARPLLTLPWRRAGTRLAVSPDREWIAAQYYERAEYFSGRGLLIVRRDGKLRDVVVDARRANVQDVRWLPNGQLVYTNCVEDCALYAIPIGGRGPHRLIARGVEFPTAS
jgi:dipeptidyl aminopeptidase/acylaminoacyl peptidase